jgi:response regulator RpfG family c-di-GMP phosphodiesterase
MIPRVLFVDDDEHLLSTFHRNFRHRYDLDTASGGRQALRAMEDHGPYAVVVADLAMPGMNGIDFMREARALAPETTRILFTGHAGPETLLAAINAGEVFRFIPKPSDAEALARAVDEGVAQYRLVVAERDLLGATLTGSLQAMEGLFQTLDPPLHARARLLEERAAQLVRSLRAPGGWPIRVAASFSPLWLLPLPREIRGRTFPEWLEDPASADLVAASLGRAADLVLKIPRLEVVAEIIHWAGRGFDGTGLPEGGPSGERLPLGSRILGALLDLGALEARVQSFDVALESLRMAGNRYDPQVIEALRSPRTGEGG